MHTRFINTTADVTRISAGAADPESATGLITALGFAPVAVDHRHGSGHDEGIWTLVEQLPTTGRLVIGWHFGRNARLRTEVVLRLENTAASTASADIQTARNQLILERAAALALPGFIAYAAGIDPLLHRASVAAPGVDAFDPQYDVHLKPALAGQGMADQESLLVPVNPVTHLDLTSAILALAELDLRITLELTLRRFAVDPWMLRALERADAALCTWIYRDAKSPAEAMRLEVLRTRLGIWRRTATGLRYDVALAATGPIDPHLVALVGRLLHGAGPVVQDKHPSVVDLCGCLPIDTPERPRLMPEPNRLADLMLSSRPKTSGSVLDGLVIGRDAADRPVAIGPTDRARHMVILGATGVGKSTLLAYMIRQDVAAGRAVILIDPHGDLYAQVRAALPRDVAAGAICADAGDFAAPFGLNLLEITGEPAAVQRNFIANQLIGVFQSVLYRGVPEAFGPMFSSYFRNALFLLMESEGTNASLANFDRVFCDPSYRRSLLERCTDPQVVRFWKEIALKAGGEAALENIAPYICSKLTQFTGNPLLAPIITAARTTLDIPGAMTRDGIVLVNLAKGLIGDQDAALLGGLITIRIFCAAMARAALPPDHRRPVRLYLDEFATYATGVLTQMLAECRKFGLELVLAGQSLDQVDGAADRPDVAHAILANVGSILAFRTGPNDAHRLANWFGSEVSPAALMCLPDQRLIARLLRDGIPSAPTPVWTGIPGPP